VLAPRASAPLPGGSGCAPALGTVARVGRQQTSRADSHIARQKQIHPVWSPHAATLVIGLAFLALRQLARTWTYTDVPYESARRMRRNTGLKTVAPQFLAVRAFNQSSFAP